MITCGYDGKTFGILVFLGTNKSFWSLGQTKVLEFGVISEKNKSFWSLGQTKVLEFGVISGKNKSFWSFGQTKVLGFRSFLGQTKVGGFSSFRGYTKVLAIETLKWIFFMLKHSCELQPCQISNVKGEGVPRFEWHESTGKSCNNHRALNQLLENPLQIVCKTSRPGKYGAKSD
jgi:hypothetical protein